MAQTHVLAAHLENHGALIADPETPSEHLIATFPVDAFEELWEPLGWVLVNRDGEPVETPEEADPDTAPAATPAADRAAERKARVQKFTRGKKHASSSSSSSSRES